MQKLNRMSENTKKTIKIKKKNLKKANAKNTRNGQNTQKQEIASNAVDWLVFASGKMVENSSKSEMGNFVYFSLMSLMWFSCRFIVYQPAGWQGQGQKQRPPQPAIKQSPSTLAMQWRRQRRRRHHWGHECLIWQWNKNLFNFLAKCLNARLCIFEVKTLRKIYCFISKETNEKRDNKE